ncbi:hypothetical protein [uncultured Pseudokineococcus sp.]|uniref:hypothetical protein n=1 Tax=uncultured Pseudokineococcus sp. TaxID=1642928 RepID=UPI002619A06A|nr:hypothetical protein [uncultured Pseudokineococcus sp.]
MAATGHRTLRQRALGFLTFFYGPADHRPLPQDEQVKTGLDGEDVGEGYRRRGEAGRNYVTRDRQDTPPDER